MNTRRDEGARPRAARRGGRVPRTADAGGLEEILDHPFGPAAEEARRWLGEEDWAELRALRQAARRATRRDGPRVYLLPGLMGSSLGEVRPRGLDVLWFDLLDTVRGRLRRLALGPGARPVRAVGVRGLLWKFYKKLEYRLQAGGCEVVVADFDWRRDLSELGRELATRLESDGTAPAVLVGHSLGGLVARAALRAGAAGRVARLIQLGTPNHGSYSALHALRGTHELVGWLAWLDLWDSREELVREVFATFPVLPQLLPVREAPDYLDPATWPEAGLRPAPALLERARATRAWLEEPVPGAPPAHLVAGVGRSTCVAARREGGEFVYDYSDAGDGTVPLALARWDGANTFFLEEEHGALPNHPVVAQVVLDLLRQGRTDRLPESWSGGRAGAPVRESALRAALERDLGEAGSRTADPADRRARHLAAVRSFLASSHPREVGAAASAPVSPSPFPLGSGPVGTAEEGSAEGGAGPVAPESATPGAEPRLDDLIAGHRRSRRLEVELARGDITRLGTRALVLGLFSDIRPAGALAAVDHCLEGAVTRVLARRMFGARAGEIFTLPASRLGLRADSVLLAGLGSFDRFGGEVQQTVAGNICRFLAYANVEEFGCVLLGSSSADPSATLREMLRGFLRGLEEADPRGRFRRVTLCENDPARLVQLRRTLREASTSDLFRGVEASFHEFDLPEAPAAAPAPGWRTEDSAPVYLLLRARPVRQGLEIHSHLMGPTARAALAGQSVRLTQRELSGLLDGLARPAFEARAFGRRLADRALTGEMRALLHAHAAHPLVLLHDAEAALLPWETLTVDDWSPALAGGLTRRFLAEQLSVAKWSSRPQEDPTLRVLLAFNPTGDLPGAEAEGERIRRLWSERGDCHLTVLAGREATGPRLARELAEGRHDLFHYAGHAFFDPAQRAESGLLCAGREVLTGREVAALPELPTLAFANACESGRVRRAPAVPSVAGGRATAPRAAAERNLGLAEALLRGGLAHFLGTHWPVGDEAALRFAEEFYGAVAGGRPFGDALHAARRALAPHSPDWANYQFYGDPAGRIARSSAGPLNPANGTPRPPR